MDNKNLSSSSQQEEDEIDLLELLHAISQGKWLILFITIIASIVSYIYAYGQTPIYKADALLRVEPQKATIPNIEDLVGLSRNENSIGTELEILKSRKNLSKAVEELKLDIYAQPKKIPLFSNLHKRFFSPTETKKPPLVWGTVDAFFAKYAWGNELIKINQLDLPQEWLNEPLTLTIGKNDTYKITAYSNVLLTGKIGQYSTSKDNLLGIFVSKLTGLPGTEFKVSKYSKRRAIASLQVSILAEEKGFERYYTGIILLSLTGRNRESIVNTLDKISQTYIEQNKSRSSEEASNALKFLKEQIKPVKEQVDKTEANLQRYRVENKTANLPQETQAILDVIVSIDEELQKYSLSRDELSQKYTAQHPTIQALNAQENKLRLRKEKTQEKISILPKAQQKLFKLEREIKVSNSIYINLLNKIQEFKIAKASTVGNAYIIDNADIDDSYVEPNRNQIHTIGTLLGFILGFVIIFLRKAFHHTINDPKKLEEAMGIPVYATIPLSKNVNLTGNLRTKKRMQKSLLAIENKNDPAIEGLRSLRTSLHFALHEAKNNIVMITGPSPYIGKSFISSNFAAVIAGTQQRVILIDADMRKGYLHKVLGQELTPGLSEFITEKATIEDVIQSVQIGDASMDVITCGQTPPNPSELLMHSHFENLLGHLSKNYDLVLIDSPPIHAVTDPVIIGSHVGVIFMVVYANRHSMKEIEYAVAHLSHSGIDTKGFIFNGYVANKTGYGYGYGYGYKSYYSDYK